MKLLTAVLFMCIIVAISGAIRLSSLAKGSEEQNSQLRRERNMYDSLYRAANTRLYNFQDSLNKHCICK